MGENGRGRAFRAFGLLLASCLFAPRVDADVVLVANPSVPAAFLSPAMALGVFSLDRRAWPNGQPVRLFVFAADSPTHAAFCHEILRTEPYQLARYWSRQVVAGRVRPKVVSSDRRMLAAIQATPGAIGYVDSEALRSLPTGRLTIWPASPCP